MDAMSATMSPLPDFMARVIVDRSSAQRGSVCSRRFRASSDPPRTMCSASVLS